LLKGLTLFHTSVLFPDSSSAGVGYTTGTGAGVDILSCPSCIWTLPLSMTLKVRFSV